MESHNFYPSMLCVWNNVTPPQKNLVDTNMPTVRFGKLEHRENISIMTKEEHMSSRAHELATFMLFLSKIIDYIIIITKDT